jgi:hypothetical protein
VYTQRLPDTQVEHDFFRSTRNSVSPDISVQPLDLCALSTTAVTQTAENLTCFPSTELESCGALRLQTGNSATELQHGLHLIHLLALVDEVLHPVVACLDLACHMRKLEANDGVIDEALAESPALVRVLDALFVADTSEAQTLNDDADTLMVEVCHDDLESLVLFADEVLDGNLDVLEGNIGSTAAPYTLAVHLASGNTTSAALDQEHRHAVHALSARADSGCEVVGPNTVGDPLLLAVYDVVFAVFGELGFAGEVRDVATGICCSQYID